MPRGPRQWGPRPWRCLRPRRRRNPRDRRPHGARDILTLPLLLAPGRLQETLPHAAFRALPLLSLLGFLFWRGGWLDKGAHACVRKLRRLADPVGCQREHRRRLSHCDAREANDRRRQSWMPRRGSRAPTARLKCQP